MDGCAICLCLSHLTWVDWQTMYVETKILVLALCLRSIGIFLQTPTQFQKYFLGLLIGAGSLYLLGLIYETVRNRPDLEKVMLLFSD